MNPYPTLKHWAVSRLTVPPLRVREEDLWIRRHAIVINSLGLAVPILSGKVPFRSSTEYSYWNRERRSLTKEDYDAYLDAMMAAIEKHIEEGAESNPEHEGVVLVVHGGGKHPNTTVKRAIRLCPEIVADGYYPIFINWNSSMVSTYFEQLLCVRSGRFSRAAKYTALFYFGSDLLTAAARFANAVISQLKLSAKRLWFYRYPTEKDLRRFQPAPPNIDVWLGDRKKMWSPLRWLWKYGMLPVQLCLSSPFVNIFVPRAWQNLKRRTRAMYRTPLEFDAKLGSGLPDGTTYVPREGAMAVFLDRLSETLAKHETKVVLIAHSMGSMITNEAVRHAPDLPYESVVYMAPACSVREFTDAVMPLLRKREGKTEAYVLDLHPKVEVEQVDWARFAPVGSVLEWLEGFLEPPNTYLDRTIGKWDNVLRTLHIFEADVRPLLHIKGFPYDGKTKPYRHVHFNDVDVPFWRKDFWRPGPTPTLPPPP